MLTWLDFLLLGVMLISALLAMMRGFTREVLSIISWASAAVAALLLYPRFQGWAREQMEPNWLADGVLIFGIFLVVLVLVSYITIRISDLILDSRVGAVDRSLGFLFGLGRGLVLMVIAFMFLVWLVPEDRQPQWVADARFRPLLQDTGTALIALLPEDPESTILEFRRGMEDGDGPPQSETPDASGEAIEPEASADQDEGQQTYGSGERESLDQLLEGTRGSGQQ